MKIKVMELIESMSEQYRVLGNIARYVRNVHPIDQADTDSLCFCKEKSDRALEIIKNSRAMVIICSDSVKLLERDIYDKTIIQVSNPRLTYSRILTKYFFRRSEPVIHPTATIDAKAKIGSRVNIGPNSYIGNCEIGDDTIIDGHVYINDRTKIGGRVIIHPGTVIGTEAIGFERNEHGELEWFPQISGVVIEDNVEIGANSIICWGSLSNTFIDKGTKIDISVKVSHGVKIGKHCIVAAGSIICGSSKIGDQAWVGPLVCIREGLTIGNRVKIGAGSVVHKNIPDNLTVTGSPARPIFLTSR